MVLKCQYRIFKAVQNLNEEGAVYSWAVPMTTQVACYTWQHDDPVDDI
jgi:hypothetical protein